MSISFEDVICIIPARGGSKNLPRKNILLLDGELDKLNYEKIPTFIPPSKMLPIIHNFIMENYYLNENVFHWNIYELKSS